MYTWTSFCQTNAEIEPLTTSKKLEAGNQLVAMATHQITIRYVPGITPMMRVKDAVGNIYQIQYIAKGQNTRRYFQQVLFATEQVTGIM